MKVNFRQIPGVGRYGKIEKVSGGISNQNFRLIMHDARQKNQLITLYKDRETWWKADKEKIINTLYKQNRSPSAKVIRIGNIMNNGKVYRYVLREFVEEKDMHRLFQNNDLLNPRDYFNLLTQLGDILSRLHSIPAENFGMLRKNFISGSDQFQVPAQQSWQKYIDALMTDRGKLVKGVDEKKEYGGITGKDIRNLYDVSNVFYLDRRKFLTGVKNPFLINYDILFKNIIVKFNAKKGHWVISALIDNEWFSAGDPDVDLIQFENCVYFSPAKEILYANRDFFIRSYEKKKKISKEIIHKRNLYHMMRSLFYLIAVYTSRQSSDFAKISDNIRNIKANYLFLKDILLPGRLTFNFF